MNGDGGQVDAPPVAGTLAMVDAALVLAETVGVRVFPCAGVDAYGVCACIKGKLCDRPGKHPMVSDWPHVATSDAERIRELWRRMPHANIGIATGTASGVAVLDVDGFEGAASLAALEAIHGALPPTVTVITPNGAHYHFRARSAVKTSTGELGKGLDTRGEGGYVIAPPSLHKSGKRYTCKPGHEIGNSPIASWPDWLNPTRGASALPAASTTRPATGGNKADHSPYGQAALDAECLTISAAKEGARNKTLNERAFKVAQLVHGGVIDHGVANDRLIEAGRACGLDDLEIKRTLRSAFDAAAQSPRSLPESAAAPTNGKAHTAVSRDQPDGLTPIYAEPLPTGVAFGSDLGLAHLLQQHHGHDMLYCKPRGGWHLWDGRRYARDLRGGAQRRIHNVGRRLELAAADLFRRAAKAVDEADQKHLRAKAAALGKWARYAQSASGMHKALEVAQTLLAAGPEDFDVDLMLLNTLSGTIELKTGVLRAHCRDDRITKLAPVAYDPKAHAPRWDAFLAEVQPDPDDRAFILRFLGYCLTGSVAEQCLLVAVGGGDNGKSVLAETVRKVMGDYAADTPANTLMMVDKRGIENDAARLPGKRFVSVKESDQGNRLDEARVKALTGGDTYTSRLLYEEFGEHIPTYKFWFYTNHLPKVRGVDHGIWRRLLIVPFDVTIAAAKKDRDLQSKLIAEAPGILASLVRACLEWQRVGLQPPAAVLAATNSYREASDDVVRFVAERCVVAAYAQVASGDLYQAYSRWWTAQPKPADTAVAAAPMAPKDLTLRLIALGYAHVRTMRARMWKGLGLRTESPPTPSDEPDGKGDADDNGTTYSAADAGQKELFEC